MAIPINTILKLEQCMMPIVSIPSTALSLLWFVSHWASWWRV